MNEAKAWDEQLTEGVGQAKNYADKMAVRYAYATNGQSIYAIDSHVPCAASSHANVQKNLARSAASARACATGRRR